MRQDYQSMLQVNTQSAVTSQESLWSRTLRFEFSLELNIFVILLFDSVAYIMHKVIELLVFNAIPFLFDLAFKPVIRIPL